MPGLGGYQAPFTTSSLRPSNDHYAGYRSGSRSKSKNAAREVAHRHSVLPDCASYQGNQFVLIFQSRHPYVSPFGIPHCPCRDVMTLSSTVGLNLPSFLDTGGHRTDVTSSFWMAIQFINASRQEMQLLNVDHASMAIFASNSWLYVVKGQACVSVLCIASCS